MFKDETRTETHFLHAHHPQYTGPHAMVMEKNRLTRSRITYRPVLHGTPVRGIRVFGNIDWLYPHLGVGHVDTRTVKGMLMSQRFWFIFVCFTAEAVSSFWVRPGKNLANLYPLAMTTILFSRYIY